MKTIIHFHRPGKAEAVYTENFVSDNGLRLDTISHPSRDIAISWSRNHWQPGGMLTEGQVIATVRKHHFYKEWFGIMQLFDPADQLLGSYCDILTPLEKRGDEYYLTDLFLDLWIGPDEKCKELDWDEFTAASHHGLIDPSQQQMAVNTLHQLVDNVLLGRFPHEFLDHRP